ncbi:hypothetical protein [Mycobacterium riyadhense]|uniref:hypothetical protein n=2 Tax=Mycobacterium riyadhense TaxID=486698 RepID=UPI00195834D0|nr:hypothetical protein [Mycobacterium riyadhense]
MEQGAMAGGALAAPLGTRTVMIMMAGLLAALFTQLAIVLVVCGILGCAPRTRLQIGPGPSRSPGWPGTRYEQHWNSLGTGLALQVLATSTPAWPGIRAGHAYGSAVQGRAVVPQAALAGESAPRQQRRQLSELGHHVIVHGGRR